jgi:DNA-binding ferritin-like protein (Dps family)
MSDNKLLDNITIDAYNSMEKSQIQNNVYKLNDIQNEQIVDVYEKKLKEQINNEILSIKGIKSVLVDINIERDIKNKSFGTILQLEAEIHTQPDTESLEKSKIEKVEVDTEKKQYEENQKIITDIICYLRVSELSEAQQEEVISDILGMFMSWEQQNKKVADMIGKDYKSFADDIIAAVNPHKSFLQKCKEYGAIIVEAFCFLLTIDFLSLYLPRIIKGNSSLTYEYSLSMAVRGLIILLAAVLIINYVGKNSFSLSNKKMPKILKFMIGSLFGLFIVFVSSLFCFSVFPQYAHV